MTLRIITLSENTAGIPGVIAEWGLSVLVETDDVKVLFDTGASTSVPHNVRMFGVELSTIDKIVLSHGHYDHTGGLKGVLQQVGKKVDVIANDDVFGDKWICVGDYKRYIGVPFFREELEADGASFVFSREPIWITSEIVTTGEIPMVTSYEAIEPSMRLKRGDGFVLDPFNDDQGLVVKTELGLIVILGCAHRGAINTIKHAQKITGVEQVHTVIGGTHLLGASVERILHTASALQEMGVQRVGVSHCTGLNSSVLLAQQLGETFFFNNTGTVITIPVV
jgi:7,8-dihydropterin-6-yl-methyl-4-(beta-D-ribofuranosyl)aminobenzene 5'-phosphate synthase